MTRAPLQVVSRYLSRLAGPPAEVSDGALLDRFVRHADTAAFARLVERHGPMVLGVCRRVLGNWADTEDAFQATFLSLARQARSVRDGDRVAAWLHAVACRSARKARGRQMPPPPTDLVPRTAAEDPAAAAAWRELCQVLDEELGRLPERLRAPLVLCYLDGATRDEAARRLGWSLGTFKRRLEQGRGLLRSRLVSRGLAPAGLAAALLPAGLRAAVPERLAQATAGLGVRFGAGASLSPAVLALAGDGNRLLGVVGPRLLLTALAACALALGAVTLRTGGAGADTPGAAEPNRPAAAAAEGKGPRTDPLGDPLPPGALARFGTVRYRHGGGFNDAALSPDGKTLLAASEIGITLFDVDTGKPRFAQRQSEVPNGFDGSRALVAFSPDGKTYASLAGWGTVRLWDAATGKELRRLGKRGGAPPPGPAPLPGPGPRPPDFMAAGLRFAEGGKSVLVHAYGGKVRFLDTLKGETVRSFTLEGSCAGISADYKTLLALPEKKSEVVLHDSATGKVTGRFRAPGEPQTAVLSADGKTLAAADGNGHVFVWDVTAGKLLHDLATRQLVTVVAVAPGGKTILAGTQRGEILRWERHTGRELPALRRHYGFVTGLLFPPGGKTLVSVSWDNVLRRWDLETGKELPPADGYATHVHAALSPDGRLAVVCDRAGRLDVWDAVTGRRLRSLRSSGPALTRSVFSPDGKTLAVGQADFKVTLWEVGSWRQAATIPLREKDTGGGAWIDTLVFSPDGLTLVASCRDDGTRLFRVADGKQLWHKAEVGRAAFSPDGKALVTGGWDHTLHFRDPATGDVRSAVKLENNPGGLIVDDIAFSPDGRTLATCHHDHSIRLRDPANGDERRCLHAHRDAVWEISFSADGKWILSAGCDGNVGLHEVATGQEVLRLQGHDARVYHAQMGPDGRKALSASWDVTALLWSLRPADVRAVQANPEAVWKDLGSDKAAAAYRAVWALCDDPDAAVNLLRGKLAPARSRLARATALKSIATLDADDFATREAAEKALEETGPAAEPLLREALEKSKSAEQTRRLRALLERLKREPSLDDFRVMRAVQALEMCGTAPARALLRQWAGGAPGILLTEQAKDALARTH